MFSGYRSSHPIAAGMLPWPSGRISFIAKLVLSLDVNGVFVPTPGPIPPLQLDVSDDAAELLYPSDFAPYKAACDVLVVGAAVRHRGIGSLTVGDLRAQLDVLESLGPRQGFCPRGDPLDPSVVNLWTAAGAEPSRFQSAPPTRRLPWPTSALRLEYERNAVHMAGEFVGPFPRALVVALDHSRVLAHVPLVIDTICLAPEHGRITVLYRGVYDRDYPADVSEQLVLDFESTTPFDLGKISGWQAFALAESRATALAQSAIASARDRAPDQASAEQVTAFISTTAIGPALPFRAAPEPGATPAKKPVRTLLDSEVDQTTIASFRAAVLPFTPTDTTGTSQPALSSAELESLRTQRPVEHDWNAPSTALISASALNDRQRHRGSLKDERVAAELPDLERYETQSEAASRHAHTHSPVFAAAKAEPPLADPAGTAHSERVRAIMQEIWKGERAVADILLSHGLTEAEWRLLRAKSKS